MYRDVQSPSNAMANTLRSIQDRQLKIERRIKWPGATQFVTVASPPSIDDDDEWHNYGSMTLDPGTWLVLAGVNFEPRSSSADSDYEMSARVTPDFIGGEGFSSGRAILGITTSDAIVLQGLLRLTEETDVDFDLRYVNYTAGQPNALIYDPYMIAVPF